MASGKDVIGLIERGSDISDYFVETMKVCDDLSVGKFIAKGRYGNVYVIDIEGVEYAAKKSVNPYVRVFGISPQLIADRIGSRCEDIASLFSSKEVFYALNGTCPKGAVYDGKGVIYTLRSDIKTTILQDPRRVSTYWIDEKKHYVGDFEYPIGSCLSPNAAYSEYIIGLLCSDLLTSGKCINFIKVVGFSMCSPLETYGEESTREVYDYTFMERIDITAKDLNPYLNAISDNYAELLLESVVIQLLFSISMMQRVLGVQHNDLGSGNIMLSISQDVTFNGESVNDKKWFSYTIDTHTIYFRNCCMIVKIGDFGHSMKYSHPIIGSLDVASHKSYESIPGWRSDSYDLLFSVMSLFVRYGRRSKMLCKLVITMLDPYADLTQIPQHGLFGAATYARSKLQGLYFQNGIRPNFTDLKYRVWDYLLNESIVGKDKFIIPESESIISLGNLDSYHPNFFDYHPLKEYTQEEIDIVMLN